MIDRTVVSLYCRIVFTAPPRSSAVALRGLPETGQRAMPLLRWHDPAAPDFAAGVADFVAMCDRRGLAAYCIPGFVNAPGRAGAADVVRLPFLILDVDSGDIENKISRAVESLGPATLVVRSGGLNPDGVPKRHLYWRLAGDTSAGRVSVLNGHAARALGGDTAFGRAHQPIRIAGSVHRKGDARPVSIESVNEQASTTVDLAFERLPSHSGGSSNALGFSRTVSLDELPMMYVGHGDARISRFEALTRMIGTLLSTSTDSPRDFEQFRAWAVLHIENVERDYDLRQHWDRLHARNRNKRRGRPERQAPARRY